jgi:hypothetical protein
MVIKFKEISIEVKRNSIKRKYSLRTIVTLDIHIIGNHLYEFDEFNDLRNDNMYCTEKNNMIYFHAYIFLSSTNSTKNSIRS